MAPSKNAPEVDALNLAQAQAFEREGMRMLYAIVGEGVPDVEHAHAAIHDKLSPAIQLFHIAGRDDEAQRAQTKALEVATKAGAAEADITELSHGLERARWSVKTGQTYGSVPPEPPAPEQMTAEQIAALQTLLDAVRAKAEGVAAMPSVGASGVGRVD